MIRGFTAFRAAHTAALGVTMFCVLSVAGCAVLPRNAAPENRLERARIPGMPPEIRALGLTPSPVLQSDFAKAIVDGGMEQACDLRAAQKRTFA